MTLWYHGAGEHTYSSKRDGRRVVVAVCDVTGCPRCGGLDHCRLCRGSGEVVCEPYVQAVACSCGEDYDGDTEQGIPDLCACGADLSEVVEQAIAAVAATHTN